MPHSPSQVAAPGAAAARSRRFASLLLLSLAAFAAAVQLLPTNGLASNPADASKPPASERGGKDAEAERVRVLDSYGRLPLRFEANRGQSAGDARFIARGGGYTLFLTKTGAVLRLRKAEPARVQGDASSAQARRGFAAPGVEDEGNAVETQYVTLGLSLEGANRAPAAAGEEPLPGVGNYFVGRDARAWRTNVPAYARVRVAEVYRGVDLVYYGTQGRLEYDFKLAPGADPRRIRLRFDGAQSARVEEGGDLVLSTEAGEVRQHKPVAYQLVGGARREVPASYKASKDGRFGFELGDYDRRLPLVIDPVLVYSTYLGGGGSDQGLGVAVDSAGSAYVTGSTASVNFPVGGGAQAAHGGLDDAFVLKLDPSGTAIVYATYLGGAREDFGNAVAVGADGSAYVAGRTFSTNFPVTAGALQTANAGGFDAFAAKLSPAGSTLLYSTYLGGADFDTAGALAADAAGNVYLAGRTLSQGLAGAQGGARVGDPVQRSTDGAANWSPSASGLVGFSVADIAVAPADPQNVYAASNAGVYRSTDGGANWQLTGAAGAPNAPLLVRSVAVDPSAPSTVYAAASPGVYKSTDGGAHYEVKSTGLSPALVNTLAVDPSAPATVYAGTTDGVYKTTNGGDAWGALTAGVPLVTTFYKLLVNPSNPQVVYAATNRGVYKTADGGAHWAAANAGILPGVVTFSLAFDPSNTNTLYVGMLTPGFGVYKSTDGGANWAASGTGLLYTSGDFDIIPAVTAIVVDPASTSNVYAATDTGGVFKSADGGAHWARSGTGLTNRTVTTLALRPGTPAALLAGTNIGSDAFAAKLDASGSALGYFKRLGGSENDEARGVAVDANGNAYVAGFTLSSNFPVANALRPTQAGEIDAFLTKLDPSGAGLVFSTYLGGSSYDYGYAVALGPGGAPYVTGTTYSDDFPTANAFQPSYVADFFQSDAFVARFAPDGQTLAYSTYLGGFDGDEDGLGLAVGADGSAYVAGTTRAAYFPDTGLIGAQRGGPTDAFVAKLSPAGSALTFGGAFGGTGLESGNGVAIDSAGAAYVVGRTTSFNFPVVNPLRATQGGGGDAFITKLGPGVELAVTLADAPDPVKLGADLTYTAVVKNKGDLAATGVTLNLTPPAGAVVASSSSSRGTCSGGVPVVCNVGALGGGEEATVVVLVKPPALKTATATAAVACNEPDPVAANNSAETSTAVQFADLSVVKRATTGLVAPGTRVNYLINVKNRDGVAATSVVLNDALPPELTFVSCAATAGGVCGGSGNQVTVTWPSLAAGASGTVLVSATLGSGVPAGTVVGNTASVASASVADPVGSNNSSTAAVTASANVVTPKSNGLIIFGSDRAFTGSTQPSGLYTVKPDGTGEKFLPGVPGFFSSPSWAPDGTKFAHRAGLDLKVVGADGTGSLTVATNVAFFTKRLSWSPDGSQIAYVGEGVSSQPATVRAINIANADGSGFGQLPNSPNFLEAADWSPDGTRFVYTNGSTISVMNLDGSGRAQLTAVQQTADGQSFDNNPRWSPDGTKILFQRSTTNHRDVYVMNADGTGQSKLLNAPSSAQPEWSPDGTKLVFESQNALYVVNFDGSGQVDITHNGFYNFEPDWQPLPNADPTPTPTPVPTFKIAGRLKPLPGAAGQPFGLVKLSGTRTAQLSSSGEFTFVNLPAGGDYTLTVEGDYYTFEPATREYKNLGADVSDADFTGTFVPADIKGRVTDDKGLPLAGIKMTSNGGFPQGTTLTDADGRYKFADVQRGRNYTVYPDPLTPYAFAPPQRNFNSLTASVTADFVGTRQPTKVISGRVTEAVTGRGIPSQLVYWGRAGVAAQAFVFTDADGNFTVGEQPTGHGYGLSIPYNDTYRFEPYVDAPTPYATVSIANLTEDVSVSFVGSRRNTVQFSAATLAASEGGVRADVAVTRAGDTASPAVVNYSTSDGTAVSTSDYTAAVGALRFAAGETTKTVSVLLTDDAHVEGLETFTLALDAPAGAQLGGVKTVTVGVADNDAAPASSNPIDSSALFVRQHYADFLNREPDASGLAFWTGEIEQCGADAACREVRRVNVSAAFFLSIEFQQTGYFAYRLHHAAFGTGETLRMKTFLRDTQEVGRGVVVGVEGWPQKLEANKRDFAEQFAARPEFVAAYPATLTPSQYVNALDANTGGSLTESERAALAAALGSGAKTRGGVLSAVAENAEFSRRQKNRAFVLMEYFGYLRRNPNDAPDADYAGHAFWLGKLEEFGGNYVAAEMVKAFLDSAEYRRRFAP
ncbi:MAG TPA: SBBP repeat-containing protein [Pyrinomonadaceae bacterium]